MTPLQILERYYQTFMHLDTPKDFFLGLGDYFDYAETIPEFDLITSEISAEPQPLFDKLATQEKAALEKLARVKTELEIYIKKNKIEDPVIQNALKEYDDYVERRTLGSATLPYSLHDELHDVVEFLYKKPEHSEFAAKYIEFSLPGLTHVRRYLPLKEVDDFLETKREIDRGYDTAIWGLQARLYEMYNVIKKGQELRKQLVERHLKKDREATWALFNYNGVMGEWKSIEEGKLDRNAIIFDINKVRPFAQRFHNHVIARFAKAKEALARQGGQNASALPALRFDANAARLYVRDKDFRIRRVSDQYDVLRVIFSDPAEIGKEWFFDEIAEKIDPARSQERLKKYYNAAYQIGLKLGSKGVPDFFITTTHSVRVNPSYLS